MIKKIVLLFLLLFSIEVYATTQNVQLGYQRKQSSTTQSQANRGPLNLPIDVTFDTDTRCLTIECSEDLDAEVFVYNSSDELIDYSTMLNSEFYIYEQGTYTLIIESEYWSASSEVVI